MIHVPYRHKTISRLGKWKAMKKCKLMILHLTRLCRKRCLLENCQVQPAILGLRPGCEDRRFVKHFVCPNFDLWTNKQTKQKQYAPQIKSGDIQFGLSRGWILRPWLSKHLLLCMRPGAVRWSLLNMHIAPGPWSGPSTGTPFLACLPAGILVPVTPISDWSDGRKIKRQNTQM